MPASTDTIYALSSGALPAGVAIIRISGPLAFEALLKLTGRELPPSASRVGFDSGSKQ